MQRNNSTAYQEAAAAGMQMEDHLINPELSLQPHALDMHAGAADARSTSLFNIGTHGSMAMFDGPFNHDVVPSSMLSPLPVSYAPYTPVVHDGLGNYPSMATPGASTITDYLPTSPAYDGNTTTPDPPFTPATPIPSTSPSTPSGPGSRYACSHPGCSTTFARIGDLRRHAKKHVGGPKPHDCPAPGCPRKGVNGFERSDKMRAHYGVCSRRVRRT
ncbi:MAG: hypothetical protein Q9176_005772 [Flavoplaca citrina]